MKNLFGALVVMISFQASAQPAGNTYASWCTYDRECWIGNVTISNSDDGSQLMQLSGAVARILFDRLKSVAQDGSVRVGANYTCTSLVANYQCSLGIKENKVLPSSHFKVPATLNSALSIGDVMLRTAGGGAQLMQFSGAAAKILFDNLGPNAKGGMPSPDATVRAGAGYQCTRWDVGPEMGNYECSLGIRDNQVLDKRF